MSTGDDKSQESSPSRSGGRSARRSGSRPRTVPTNIIEFVDSEDPNVKSAIQRHTTYHSAAQRREARLHSLRQGSRTRYLDWGRRQGSDSTPAVPSSESGSSQWPSPLFTCEQITHYDPGSPKASLATLLPTPDPTLSRQSSDEPTIRPLMPSEEAMLRSCKFYIRVQHQGLSPESAERQTLLRSLSSANPESALTTTDIKNVAHHSPDPEAYEAVILFMLDDTACTKLLLAYCHSLRARLQEAEGVGKPDEQAAQEYLCRWTNNLWNRLRDTNTASSDVNIQAVLLLVSYTSDFGQADEVSIHAEALPTMVEERGGLEALRANTVLHRQLIAADKARRYHLTLDCRPDCHRVLRFPNGFWATRQ